MTTWHKETISLAIPDARGPHEVTGGTGAVYRFRRDTVKGFVNQDVRGLAVTPWHNAPPHTPPDYDENLWGITHVDSGALVFSEGYSLDLAKNIVEALGPVTDWTRGWDEFTLEDEVPQRARQTADAVIINRETHAEITEYHG